MVLDPCTGLSFGPEFEPLESGKTARVILARHGEVEARHRGTIYGRLDVPLSERGLEQSERVAEAVRDVQLDAVVSSGLQRAEAAAALVRASHPHLRRVDDERFLELDRGDWASREIAELRETDHEAYRAWIDSRGAVQAPGGESPAELARRTEPAFRDWAERTAGGAVMIVAHLWVVRSAVASALGLPMERSPQLGLPPGGLVELSWPTEDRSARPRLVTFGANRIPRC